MIRVIGVGSPFGDDRVGLEAAAALAAAPRPGVEVVAADRPGVDLLALFDGAEAAILIDAVRSGAAAGTLHDIDLRAVPADLPAPVSSHGVGVAEALALARALDRLPPRGRLIGVAARAGAAAADGGLSAPVAHALAAVLERVQTWLDALAATPRPASRAPRRRSRRRPLRPARAR